ncbi:MAG TPA: hypothetical protein VD931_12790, partial [Baekduia sp.]|nr:hypothetical protein [Baekduia sp.]
TLLGETYVELTPGSKGADEIEEGGRLRNVRVQPTVEFDELLRIFDADTRDAFRAWQRSSVKAFEGEGDRANAVFGNLPGFVENAQSVVDVLNRRREALTQLIRGTGDTFEALTRNEAALRGLITSNRAALEALAAKRESLAESFRIFPTFLRESRATLNRLETFSGETTPLVRDLEPVLRDAAPTLASLRRLAPDLENLFVEFRPLIAAGEQGLPAMGRIFRGMAPTLKELGPLLQQLNPVLEMLELYQTTVSDFLNTGPTALANTLAKQPGTNGHALPQVIVLGSDTLPQTRRSAANRGNAYIPPDGYNDRTGPFVRPDRFILPTWDCANAGGEKPPTDRNPGCELSDKIPFQGRLQKFPQVHPSGAGGVSTQPGRGATPAR